MLRALKGRHAAPVLLLILATAPSALAQQVFVISPTPGTDPKISSDGKVVAYSGSGGLTTDRPDGSATMPWGLSISYEIELTGDGRLAVYDYLGNLEVLDTLTGQLSTIHDNVAMASVSDDGSIIAFEDSGSFGLHVIHPDGTGHQHLGVYGYQGGPSLTADGSAIVYEDWAAPYYYYFAVFRINSDGTGPAQLTDANLDHEIRPRISGDGETITYENFDGGFHAIDGDGSNPRDLVTGVLGNWNGEGYDYSDVSLDGRVGVYSAWEGVFVAGTDGSWVRQIYDLGGPVDISGTGDVVITAHWNRNASTIGVPGIRPGEMMDMDIAADGQTLTWATRPSAYSHNLYRARWSSAGALSPAAAGDCLEGSITGTTAVDANTPALNEVFGYFVTGENAWGEGPSETTPQGVERVPALSCPGADSDGDSFPDAVDVCPLDADPNQADPDGDGLGSLCDNCPDVANPDQFDFDHDGIGNACDV